MPRPNVLVIAVDGLRASALGAYGNTWYRTPTFDRIAAQSILCDWCFADSTDLRLLYRGLWQAKAALRPTNDNDHCWSLPANLSKLGYSTQLVADDEALAGFPATEHFSEAVLWERQPIDGAEEVEQTCAAGVLAEVLNFIEEEQPARQPWFLWAHLSGLYGPWDAPHELALSLVEEDDAPPQPSTLPPASTIDRQSQADEIYAQSCRYAAQVMALDALLEPLSDLLDDGVVGDCLFVVLGTRGFPLGEHGQLGGFDTRLYSEQLHVPLMVRLSGEQDALSRVSHLVHPADVSATILGALAAGGDAVHDGFDFIRLLHNPRNTWRSFLLASETNKHLSIRTPAWYLRGIDRSDEPAIELFVKPDDRWEVNNVANLCPNVAAELAEVALAERERVLAGEPLSRMVLPPALVEPAR